MFRIKQNDTLPNLEVQLLDSNNEPIDLSLCGVKFHMGASRTMIKIDRMATITDELEGKVIVDWQEGDTSEVGNFLCEFQVTLPDGEVMTVPNDGYFAIRIINELA